MRKKDFIEIQVTQNDYSAFTLVDGISMKLNVGDKIVVERGNINNESMNSSLWSEDSLRIIRRQPHHWFPHNSNNCFIQIVEKLFHENYIELHGIVIQPDDKFYSKSETYLEKEESQRENSKDQLYSELNEEAPKANYIKYSPDKLVRGQFGKIMHGKENLIEYILLSDRHLDREPLEGYFYLLRIPTLSCGGFWRETGERSESCKVIEMEDIDETKALERYNKFLSVWKE